MSTTMQIVNAIVAVAFVIASYTDIKSRKIPVWLFPTATVIVTVIRFIGNEYNIFAMIAGFMLFFWIFFLGAVFAKGGGGDAIMMGCVGAMIYPLNTIYVFILSGAVYMLCGIVLVIIKKNKNKLRKMTFPYAPFAGVGFVALNILQMI